MPINFLCSVAWPPAAARLNAYWQLVRVVVDSHGLGKTLGRGDEVPPDAQIALLDDAEARYVSRSGLKRKGRALIAAIATA